MTRLLFCGMLVPLALLAQGEGSTHALQSVDVVLERSTHGDWTAIDPGLILDSGDLVRFRFRTNFDGFLYVINSGTSGTQSLLFPGEATGKNNRVQAGADYFVPSTSASFKIAGPPGHDIIYWLVSPVPLAGNLAGDLVPETPHSPARLMPRCDESIFRARGLCIDSGAGPRNVPAGEPLPPAIGSVPNMTRRELVIMQNKTKARVTAPGALNGPVIYEFRVAHR